VPLFLLRFGQAQYIDRTRLIVNQLRDNNQALENKNLEISKLNEGLLNALAEIIDARDPYVLGHSKQVTRYAVMIAVNLGLPSQQVDTIRKASLLHDIGKVGISEKILSKPGALNLEEIRLVKTHPTLGARILESSHSLHELIPIVKHHHERFDGKGYPDGLKGGDIPIEARVVALADSVEAMASDRAYRKAMTFADILEEIKKGSGSQFDPAVVDAFLKSAQGEGETLIENSAQIQQARQFTPALPG
jgi:putative nucleotidyltransferase with HDIG domain